MSSSSRKIAQRNPFLKNKSTITYIHDIYHKLNYNTSNILKTKHPHHQNSSKIKSTSEMKSISLTKTMYMYISRHLYQFQVRSNVRNSWAHCNFQEWDSIQYQESFQIMFQLVNHLQLNTADETRIMTDLTKWETNGITQ